MPYCQHNQPLERDDDELPFHPPAPKADAINALMREFPAPEIPDGQMRDTFSGRMEPIYRDDPGDARAWTRRDTHDGRMRLRSSKAAHERARHRPGARALPRVRQRGRHVLALGRDRLHRMPRGRDRRHHRRGEGTPARAASARKEGLTMSGGAFDYKQYEIRRIADEIEERMLKGNYFDGGDPLSAEVLEKFREGLAALRLAEVYAQRIDWLLSGDDGEDTFIKRLADDLSKLPKE